MPVTSSGPIKLKADIATEFTALGTTNVRLLNVRGIAGTGYVTGATNVRMKAMYGTSSYVTPAINAITSPVTGNTYAGAYSFNVTLRSLSSGSTYGTVTWYISLARASGGSSDAYPSSPSASIVSNSVTQVSIAKNSGDQNAVITIPQGISIGTTSTYTINIWAINNIGNYNSLFQVTLNIDSRNNNYTNPTISTTSKTYNSITFTISKAAETGVTYSVSTAGWTLGADGVTITNNSLLESNTSYTVILNISFNSTTWALSSRDVTRSDTTTTPTLPAPAITADYSITTGYINVSWGGFSGDTNYVKVYWEYPQGTSQNSGTTKYGANNIYNITGITAGTSVYNIKIRAYGINDTAGDYSNIISSVSYPSGTYSISSISGNSPTQNNNSIILTRNGSFTINLYQPITINYLLVGGGAGGGYGGSQYTYPLTLVAGGGGGAGAIIYNQNIALPRGTYRVIVGIGGNGSSRQGVNGSNGGESSFNGGGTVSDFTAGGIGGEYGGNGGTKGGNGGNSGYIRNGNRNSGGVSTSYAGGGGAGATGNGKDSTGIGSAGGDGGPGADYSSLQIAGLGSVGGGGGGGGALGYAWNGQGGLGGGGYGGIASTGQDTGASGSAPGAGGGGGGCGGGVGGNGADGCFYMWWS